MSKNSKHDAYIVKHYLTKSVGEIAKELGIPKGSVITRYAIATGARKGNDYYPTGAPSHRPRMPGKAKIKMDKENG